MSRTYRKNPSDYWDSVYWNDKTKRNQDGAYKRTKSSESVNGLYESWSTTSDTNMKRKASRQQRRQLNNYDPTEEY